MTRLPRLLIIVAALTVLGVSAQAAEAKKCRYTGANDDYPRIQDLQTQGSTCKIANGVAAFMKVYWNGGFHKR